MTARGVLRIYLGAAPGVGKSYAALDEARRRAERGTDVVVACLDTHGRPRTEEAAAGLPRCGAGDRLDAEAVLARRPRLAVVDDLARRDAGTPRWTGVQRLLDAGIDVLSTVNVQQLESLREVVADITGVPEPETVPDAVVRAADQVELVDMTPEALRRRMAHGNIYPPERIDAALGDYFRPGTLTALRELALLWLADRVEEGMQRYREQHAVTTRWETRERVVVALTGGPESAALVRRAARLAARTAGDLLAVHVTRSSGAPDGGRAGLESSRLLVESVGGSYHSVVGDDVGRALVDFARRVEATQLVIGASRRRRRVPVLAAGTGATVVRRSGPIDVHVVGHDHAGRGRSLPSLGHGLTPRRRLAGFLTAAVLLAVVTPVLAASRGRLALASDVSVFLLVVVVTSLVGGFWPAAAAAIVGSLLLNYFLVEPLHTFTIAERQNILALVIFLVVAVLVSRVVDLSARRSAAAARATAESETLAALAGSLLRGAPPLPALLERVQETFAMRAVSLLQPGGDGARAPWSLVAGVGDDPPVSPADGDATAQLDAGQVLVLCGHPLRAEDQRLLSAFAAQVAVAFRERELAEAARALEPLTESERARTALLNAVSHDLRTPIAAAKTAVSSLRASDVEWSEPDRDELLLTADAALDRLTDLVTNLLDLSRLQAGVLPVSASAVGVDDVVAAALAHAAPANAPVDVEVPEDLPAVVADAGLLERVVANLVQNALRHAPGGTRVAVHGSAHRGRVELRVVDRGPGIPPAESDTVFTAFQRRGDAPSAGAGVGLGLAIARGFSEAMGGTVHAEETPGGGATLVVDLPAAGSPAPAGDPS